MGQLAFAALAILGGQQGGQPAFVSAEFPGLHDPAIKVMLMHNLQPLPVAKISPKNGWKFPYASNGYGMVPGRQAFNIRFRVFSQTNSGNHDDIAQWTTRTLVRLWDYTYFRTRRDHALPYRCLVDVYLCQEGEPGGEQIFAIDDQDLDANDRPQRVNTIYIYQIQNATNKLELLREICHEYGHAVMPPIGPYKAGREAWANGDMGERLYLYWLSQDLAAGRLTVDDALFAKSEEIKSYLDAKFWPMAQKTALSGPDLKVLEKGDVAAYDEMISLACYAAAFLPQKTFGRAMNLTSQEPAGFAKAVSDAAAELPEWKVEVPEAFAKKPVYLPIGDAKVSGGKVLARKGNWAKVQLTGKQIVVSRNVE